jgi:hypothetical protein
MFGWFAHRGLVVTPAPAAPPEPVYEWRQEWRIVESPHGGAYTCERRILIRRDGQPCESISPFRDWHPIHTAETEDAARLWIERERRGPRIIDLEPETTTNSPNQHAAPQPIDV